MYKVKNLAQPEKEAENWEKAHQLVDHRLTTMTSEPPSSPLIPCSSITAPDGKVRYYTPEMVDAKMCIRDGLYFQTEEEHQAKVDITSHQILHGVSSREWAEETKGHSVYDVKITEQLADAINQAGTIVCFRTIKGESVPCYLTSHVPIEGHFPIRSIHGPQGHHTCDGQKCEEANFSMLHIMAAPYTLR